MIFVPVTVRHDLESGSYVGYIPLLQVYSAGSTAKEAIAAVYEAAALHFQYLSYKSRDTTSDLTIEQRVTLLEGHQRNNHTVHGQIEERLESLEKPE